MGGTKTASSLGARLKGLLKAMRGLKITFWGALIYDIVVT